MDKQNQKTTKLIREEIKTQISKHKQDIISVSMATTIKQILVFSPQYLFNQLLFIVQSLPS